jgi:hypothetical protein
MERNSQTPTADIATFVPEWLKSALAILLSSADYALDNCADRWQFAVEIADLLSNGAMLVDIRWLILRGLAVHAKETTIPGDSLRSFRALPPTSFPPDTCLMLSPDGAAALRGAVAHKSTVPIFPEAANPTADHKHTTSEPAPIVTPEWDAAHRELRLGQRIVKRYRVPARNQELVLQAFQEEGWPEFIDDPLPPLGEQAPKHRLLATIKSLNRNQLDPVIRFHGNGNGLQVHWKAVSAD